MLFIDFTKVTVIAATFASNIFFGNPFFRNSEFLDFSAGKTETAVADDLHLVQRLIKAYRSSLEIDMKTGQSCWQLIFDWYRIDAHKSFIEGDVEVCANILRNPSSNNMLFGMDNMLLLSQFSENPKSRNIYPS